jgi:hypothetical protein
VLKRKISDAGLSLEIYERKVKKLYVAASEIRGQVRWIPSP